MAGEGLESPPAVFNESQGESLVLLLADLLTIALPC